MLPTASVSAISSCGRSCPPSTPTKFIISPKPITKGHVIDSAMSSAVMELPVSSKPGTAGTQDGVVTMALSGVRSTSCCMILTPSRPSTLQISCGSHITPAVPWGTTARAYSPAPSIDDSMCMCPSRKPGAMQAPPASITHVPSPIQCSALPT